MALAAGNGPGSPALMASELMARGRNSAAALEALLQGAPATTSAPPQHGGIRVLAEQILCCLDRALAALHGEGPFHDATGGCQSKKRGSPPGAVSQARPPKRRTRAIGAEMPPNVKKMSTPDDGFMWRKYGQKNILNSKYPRTYFRCTYKHDKSCKATRQVQQSDDDPSIYIVTYFGEHTCGTAAAVAGDEKPPQLVIKFSSGTPSSSSPWPSSYDDVGSNSSRSSPAVVCLPKEEGGEQQKANACNVEPVLQTPPAEPSSSADDVCCASPDLHAWLDSFELDYCGDSMLDMELVNFDEYTLLQ